MLALLTHDRYLYSYLGIYPSPNDGSLQYCFEKGNERGPQKQSSMQHGE